MSYSGGWTTEHSGMASAHRGWNRQPGGGAATSGGAPAMPVSGTLGPRTEGNASSRARAYGCRGVPNSDEVEPSSATCPAYITSTRSEKFPTSEMSWVTKIVANPSRSCSSLICRIRDRWATTSSAEVGSSMMTRSGVNSSAMAIMHRCRIPPESWCG